MRAGCSIWAAVEGFLFEQFWFLSLKLLQKSDCCCSFKFIILVLKHLWCFRLTLGFFLLPCKLCEAPVWESAAFLSLSTKPFSSFPSLDLFLFFLFFFWQFLPPCAHSASGFCERLILSWFRCFTIIFDAAAVMQTADLFFLISAESRNIGKHFYTCAFPASASFK